LSSQLSVTTIHDNTLGNAPSAEEPYKSTSDNNNCFILTQIAHCFPQQKKERKKEKKRKEKKRKEKEAEEEGTLLRYMRKQDSACT
jgi:hypothetical protein